MRTTPRGTWVELIRYREFSKQRPEIGYRSEKGLPIRVPKGGCFDQGVVFKTFISWFWWSPWFSWFLDKLEFLDNVISWVCGFCGFRGFDQRTPNPQPNLHSPV